MEAILPLLAVIPWAQIAAWAMPFIVLWIVSIIKKNHDELRPYLPVLAPILGAVLPLVAGALGAWLGIAVDFSPILVALEGAMAGAVAVNMHQIWNQRKKQRIYKSDRDRDKV